MKRLLALLFLAGVSPALAQQFPVVPDHTVIGRAGTGSSSGPSQALPWSTLLANLVGAQSANTVYAGPSSGSANTPGFRALVGADLPPPGASSLGGVQSKTCSTSNWFNSLGTNGVFGCSQPSFADLTSSLACSQHPALTGDVTTSAGSCATTISANAVTNAKMATMNAWTMKVNNSSSSATPTDVTIDGLTVKSTPTTSDEVPIWDAASSSMKKATLAAVASLATAGTTPILLQTLTPSAQASIATSISWSGYSSIEIHFMNVIPVTNNSNLLLQYVTGGGTQSSSYTSQILVAATTTVTGAAGPTSSIDIAPSVPNTASQGTSGTVRIYNIASAANKITSGTVTMSSGEIGLVGGIWTGGTAALTGAVFSFSSGNISSGTIEIWGIP